MITGFIALFFTSFVIALSGALMPGPLLTMTISESSHRGWLAGPMMILGHGILELAVVAALLSGFAPLLLRDDVFVTVSLVGGAVLIWIAFTMLRSVPQLSLVVAHNSGQQRNLVIAGIVLSAFNPYFILWWASIGLGYIVYAAKFGGTGIACFFLGHILADLSWYTFISFGVVKGKRYMSDRGYRGLICGCAVLLVVFSGYFFYSGINRLV